MVFRPALRLPEQACGDEDMPADMADSVAPDARYSQEITAEAREQVAVCQEEAGDHRGQFVDPITLRDFESSTRTVEKTRVRRIKFLSVAAAA